MIGGAFMPEKKSRHIALLLYPDNPDHVAALDEIRMNYPSYIGILHLGSDGGKDHWHIYLDFPNPVYSKSIASELVLDERFCRPLFGQFSNCLLYLIHLNASDKEQYSIADCFGSSALLQKLEKCVLRFQRKEIDMCDAVEGCIDWIQSQTGVISAAAFARWACASPFFKGVSHILTRYTLEEHNALVKAREERERGCYND